MHGNICDWTGREAGEASPSRACRLRTPPLGGYSPVPGWQWKDGPPADEPDPDKSGLLHCVYPSGAEVWLHRSVAAGPAGEGSLWWSFCQADRGVWDRSPEGLLPDVPDRAAKALTTLSFVKGSEFRDEK